MRVAGKFSYTLVGVGSLTCFVFFPFLNVDLPASLVYSYQAGMATYYCMAACVLTSVGLSCTLKGQLEIKDLLYSPLAGGVAIGSSAGLISNSAGAITLGFVAGVVHVLLSRW